MKKILNVEEIMQILTQVAENQAKSEARFEKERAEDRKAMAELRQEVLELKKLHAKTEKIFGDLGLSQGYIAEDLFYRNVKKVFKKYHKEFHQVYRNLKKKSVAEFDIIAVNNTEVLVLEIKAKLSNKSIDHFTINRLPRFKEFFPQYANYKIIGGVGALIVPDSVEKYAEKKGLYVITQTSDGGAFISNKPNFKEKVFC